MTDIKIPFNIPPYIGSELENIRIVCERNHKICGDGPFTKKCKGWFEARTNTSSCLLTTSGTDALELAALLTGVSKGDEVIMPAWSLLISVRIP